MSTPSAPVTPQPAAVRPGLRRFLAPLAVGVGALAGAAVLVTADPSGQARYPLCPFHAVTGLDCPGCGTMRGLHDLLRGDVVAALDHNVLLAVLVPLAVVLFVTWVRRLARGSAPRFVLAPRWVAAVLTVGVVFWVVRNLPGVPFLAAA